jgi:hypothetical protein
MEFLLAEDRDALRHAVAIRCQVVRERGFVLLGDRAVDVSAKGMLITSSRHAIPGEPVFVSFQVPGTPQWIDTEGTVARVSRGRRMCDSGPTIGITFAPLPPEDHRLLRWVLRRLAPPLPARAVRIDYAATAALIALSFHY